VQAEVFDYLNILITVFYIDQDNILMMYKLFVDVSNIQRADEIENEILLHNFFSDSDLYRSRNQSASIISPTTSSMYPHVVGVGGVVGVGLGGGLEPKGLAEPSRPLPSPLSGPDKVSVSYAKGKYGTVGRQGRDRTVNSTSNSKSMSVYAPPRKNKSAENFSSMSLSLSGDRNTFSED